MSYTPFNAPLLAPLLGDRDVIQHFSVAADIAAMIRFEVALAEAEAAEGIIPSDAAAAVAAAADSFEPAAPALGQASARDGLAVPEFVALFRRHVGAPHGKHVHFGTTSQDVIDTSLVLRLVPVIDIYENRLRALIEALDGLRNRFGDKALMGQTRMQAALPITVADRLSAWRTPLDLHLVRMREIAPRLLRLQLAGAVGTKDKLGDLGDKVAGHMANALGIGTAAPVWQTDRTGIVEFTSWLSLVSGSLGKMGQDIALMAQSDRREITVSGAGGSSAMPHKQNPVKAEALVTLARFNATLAGGMNQALVHEQERSGAAWTLEWMLLPQMAAAAGASLRLGLELLTSVERMGSPES